jgi:legumain
MPQVMHARGVPDEQIIVMLYDDVVKSFFNTRKGSMYNEPNGPDVYAGVPKDYTSKHITPKNFLAVLSGDAAAMAKVPGSGRVIDSGPNDRIFVYFADHGAPGMLAFPSKLVVFPTKLLARDLIHTIEAMHAGRRFSQMLLYIEACESGSMFNGLLKPDMGVLAVTAAAPNEPSYACYYNNTLGTFLGFVIFT